MVTVAQAARVVAVEAGEPEAYVAQVARNLLNSGILPRNSGGRLSQVDAAGLALLVLATYTARTFREATERALTYGRLTWGGTPDGLALAEFLVRALMDAAGRPDRRVHLAPRLAVPVDELRLEIVTSYPLAIVSHVPSAGPPAFKGSIYFAGCERDAATWPSGKPRRSVTLPGEFLFNVMARLGLADIQVGPAVARGLKLEGAML